MSGFDSLLFAAVLVAFAAGVFACIYKGSRPPQRLPEHPIPPEKASVASVIPVVCAAILYATFKSLSWYLRDHLAIPGPFAFLIILIGVIAPWCVGIYSAYRAARAENKALRATGSLEVLIFLLAASAPLVSGG